MTTFDTILRDETAQANADAMCAVLLETGYPIPASAYAKWRPTLRVTGVIPGMPVKVTCVATDGNLGLFVPTSSEAVSYLGSAFLGHCHRFQHADGGEGVPPTLHSAAVKAETQPKRERKLSKRRQILNSL